MNKKFKLFVFIAVIISVLTGCGADNIPKEQKMINNIKTETKLDDTKSQNIYNVLTQLGIDDFKLKAEPTMDNLNKAGEKAYSLKYKDEKREVIVLIAPNGSVWKVMYRGYYLYENGEVKNKIQDYIISEKEWQDAALTSEVIMKNMAMFPDTAEFDLASWMIRKNPDRIKANGVMEVENSFGKKIKYKFTIIYTPDMKTAKNVIVNGRDLGSINLQ